MEQCVIVDFRYGEEELDALHQLDLKLHALIEQAGVGQYDFHELNVDGTGGKLFMYGPNAETLFKTVLPELQQTSFMKDATAMLRFGPADADSSSIEVPIHPAD